MPSYKFTYFNTSGRGDPIRILFALADVPFEDVRVPIKEWPALKPKTPLGTLPVLSVDGVEFGQTQAILRYLAREFGFAGPDTLSSAIADSLADQMADFMAAIFPWHGVNVGFVPGDKAELYKTVFLPARDKHFPLFEKALSKSSSGWLAATPSLTHADIFVGCVIEMLLRLVPEPPTLLVDFPLLARHQAKFTSIAKVAEHIANRPKDLWF
ncbi:hypothetical protein PMAYCL1PPCAC_15514 [Pristionchus mayeri]|uniref:Glutathione S-transferase n=1 Tax=Pristionchus mayeri TaxID=1317129 RepID=A0AAN5CJ50_9BILA|nr:hypothetical protein PMAYCL1PPCAC_15514 [Pristionchus mayeri]